MHELPLVFFTVFGQAAVGIFLLSFLTFSMGQITSAQLKVANLSAIVLLAIGSAIGGLHMGQPLRALNLLAGLGRSPMSNEIVLSGVFFACAGATVLLSLKSEQEKLRKLCNALTVISGLLFAWSITQVYQLATVASWDTAHTSLQMWLTVLVTGGMFAVLFGAKKIGAVAASAGVLISIGSKPDYIGFVTEQVPALAAQQHTLWGIQAVTLVIGMAICLIALVRSNTMKPALMCGAAAVLVGELIGRIAFYNLWAIPM